MTLRKKIACGTYSGYWKNLAPDTSERYTPSILLHVITSAESFTFTPKYFITLYGNCDYWMISTENSVCNATAHGFDVVLRLPEDISIEDFSFGGHSSFADFANAEAWGVYWYAVAPTFRGPEIPDTMQAKRMHAV